MHCIFCLKEKSASEEHVFPEAIGGGLVIDRVCRDCNSDLGTTADARVSNHPLVLLARSQLGIAGKRGGIPDPFRDVFRIGALADDPTQRVRASLPEREGESLQIELLYNRSVKKLEDGSEAIQIAIDACNEDQITTIIQRERGRAGMAPLAEDELRAAIQGATHGRIEQPWVRYKVPVDIEEYKRGVAKIVYELAWHWLGDRYLDDPIAVALRNVITGPELVSECAAGLGIRGSMTLGADALPLVPWKHNPNVHIGLAMRTGDHVTVAVRIFSCMCGLIQVSDNASTYAEFAPVNHDGRFIEIEPRSGATRECSLANEISRLTGHSPGMRSAT
jgi:hypothetical protein